MPAPAETDIAPLEPFRSETLFNALDEALNVSVNDPAPDALANDMLLPPTNAILSAFPVTDVPPPLKDCVPPAAALAPTIVIEEALLESVILFPAMSDTLPVEALRLKFAPAGTSALIVIVEALLWRLMLLPATRLTLPMLPFKLKFCPGTAVPTPTLIIFGSGRMTLIVEMSGICGLRYVV